MTTDRIGVQEISDADWDEPGQTTGAAETCARITNQIVVFVAVLSLALGLGLYHSGHLDLKLPSAATSQPPPLNNDGRIGPLDEEINGLRRKHWWWLRWFE